MWSNERNNFLSELIPWWALICVCYLRNKIYFFLNRRIWMFKFCRFIWTNHRASLFLMHQIKMILDLITFSLITETVICFAESRGSSSGSNSEVSLINIFSNNHKAVWCLLHLLTYSVISLCCWVSTVTTVNVCLPFSEPHPLWKVSTRTSARPPGTRTRSTALWRTQIKSWFLFLSLRNEKIFTWNLKKTENEQ